MFEQEFTKDDYQTLKKLASNEDFHKLKEIVDKFQHQRAYNLLRGSEVEKGIVVDELYNYRGGYQLWRKVVELVETAAEKLSELEKEHGE